MRDIRILCGQLRVFATVFAVSTALTSCATVDRFSSRAVEYSRQTALAANQEILLNILRAAHRQPMHFVSVTQINGVGEASGGIDFGFPLNPEGRNFEPTPKFSFKGGPTFTVNVLDKQEFYNGILTPLKISEIGLFVKQGIPMEVLFALFVRELVVVEGTSSTPIHYVNDFRPDPDVLLRPGEKPPPRFFRFNAYVNELVELGLTMETRHPPIPVGSAIPADKAAAHTARLPEFQAQGLDIVSVRVHAF